jgi:uncharacterized integral membrane protein
LRKTILFFLKINPSLRHNLFPFAHLLAFGYYCSTKLTTMSGKVIVFLILSVLLIIFTIQNQLQIDIRFFKWEIKEVPLVVVLIAGLIFGFLLALMMQLTKIMRLKKELKNVIDELENPKQVEADSDEEITSEGISMGSDYKGGFFNE